MFKNSESLKLEVSTKNKVIDAYTNKRKSIEREDVEDLYDVMVDFIKHKMKDKETFALELPNIGVLYRKFNPENIVYAKSETERNFYEEQLRQYLFKINKRANSIDKDVRCNLEKWL